jgi:L-lactate permease
MDREFRIAIALVGLIAAWVVALVLLVRYAIPMVLEARFTGAMFVAVVLGVGGLLALAWAASRIYLWARRALGR